MDTKSTTSETRMVKYFSNGGMRPITGGTTSESLVESMTIDMRGNARYVQGRDQQGGVTGVRRQYTARNIARKMTGGSISSNVGSSLKRS